MCPRRYGRRGASGVLSQFVFGTVWKPSRPHHHVVIESVVAHVGLSQVSASQVDTLQISIVEFSGVHNNVLHFIGCEIRHTLTIYPLPVGQQAWPAQQKTRSYLKRVRCQSGQGGSSRLVI